MSSANGAAHRSDIARPDIVIADDSGLFRGMVAAVLEPHAVVRQAADVPAALAEITRRTPDLVILDIRMPPTHTVEGLDAAVLLRARHPRLGVLVLSQHLEVTHLDRLLAGAGAGFGYLLKERVSGIADFVAAVHTVAAGGHAVDPEVIDTVLGRRRARDLTASLPGRLRAVLELIAQGHTNSAIADRLHLSPKSVEAYANQIFTRLGLPADGDRNRRVLAVLSYLRSLHVPAD